MSSDKIEMMFQLMEYDYLTDEQHKLIVSFESQYNNRGLLSDRQFEILRDLFEKASSKSDGFTL